MNKNERNIDGKAEGYWELGVDAIGLAACALNGKKAQWDSGKDLELLYEFCKFHSITAVIAAALEGVWKTCPPADPAQAACWKQAKDMAIRRSILFNTERQIITAYLEEVGCWHMPLKGSLLQFDYPQFGMRQMTDNDILVDPDMRDKIHDFLVKRGYLVGFYRQNEVDTYQKPPVYNFEMHMALFSKEEGKDLERYYRGIREKAQKDEGNRWGYHLTDEDFYIYMVAHAYKHMIHSGIGIRYLLDVHVFLEKHGKTLDWNYVKRELKKLEADEFEHLCRSLRKKLLGDKPDFSALSEDEQELLQALFVSGTFGTAQQRFFKKFQNSDGKITVGTKLKYMFKRVFPSMELLRVDYPDIDRKKWKIPFILIWRVIRSIFVTPLKTLRELSRAWGVDKS